MMTFDIGIISYIYDSCRKKILIDQTNCVSQQKMEGLIQWPLGDLNGILDKLLWSQF